MLSVTKKLWLLACGAVLMSCGSALPARAARVSRIDVDRRSAVQPPDAAPNAIQVENQRAGTPGWDYLKGSQKGEIQAYGGEDSVNRGDTLHLYVNSTRPYTVKVYRLGYYHGVGARLIFKFPARPGLAQGAYVPEVNPGRPLDCPTCTTGLKDELEQETNLTDAHWKMTDTITFPPTAVSGIYLVKLTQVEAGWQWLVPVVVRDDTASADLVFQDPVNTDQAYNTWGGTSLYSNHRRSTPNDPQRAYYVSFNRPYEQNAGSGYVLEWTYAMLRFLEEHGYDVRYTTNTAVDQGLTNLSNYRGFVSAGHDEYWSQAERDQLEAAIQRGVSVAFFGANDIYWQARSRSDQDGGRGRWLVCYKRFPLDPLRGPGPLGVSLATAKWRDPPLNDPEDEILVAMYNGLNNLLNQDLVVHNTRHWAFAGTGLRDGDRITGILGPEVDSILDPQRVLVRGERITTLAQSPFITSTPRGGTVTATAVLRELDATSSLVFNAGTIFWPFGLTTQHRSHNKERAVPESAALRQMTNNILRRMVRPGVGATVGSDPISNLTLWSRTSSLQVRFTGPQNPAVASDPGRYAVLVNGRAVAVESAAYNANGPAATLSLPAGLLHAGDQVVVRCRF